MLSEKYVNYWDYLLNGYNDIINNREKDEYKDAARDYSKAKPKYMADKYNIQYKVQASGSASIKLTISDVSLGKKIYDNEDFKNLFTEIDILENKNNIKRTEFLGYGENGYRIEYTRYNVDYFDENDLEKMADFHVGMRDNLIGIMNKIIIS